MTGRALCKRLTHEVPATHLQAERPPDPLVAHDMDATVRQAAARAVEANMFAYWLALGRGDHSALCDGPDLKWAYTGRPVLNRVVGAQHNLADADARTADVVARFGSWGRLGGVRDLAGQPSQLPA